VWSSIRSQFKWSYDLLIAYTKLLLARCRSVPVLLSINRYSGEKIARVANIFALQFAAGEGIYERRRIDFRGCLSMTRDLRAASATCV